MKGNYDQHHRELEFVESDWVWMRLHHRLAATLTNKARGKLAPKFYVSFQVLACISPIAYRLALPPKCRIHDVFHVLFLKKFTGTPPAVVPRLPPIKHGRMLPQPEKVLRTRLNRGVWEILVQWMGQTTADATWEKVPEFKDAYPSFQLKDELFSIWGGECCGCFHWEKISATAQAKRGPAGPISAAHSPAGAAHILAGPDGRREAAHSGLRKLIFEL
jgi:hypothetical protein